MKFLKRKWNWILLFLVTVLVMSFVLSDPTLLGHDTNFHLANIENLKQQISWNHLFPIDKIVPNLSHNMGYGLYLFYPMLPHLLVAYLAKVGGLFALSTETCLALFYGTISVISIFLVALIGKKISKSNLASFATGIIFLCMPYRLGTMTVRGSLNESMISVFLPLLFLSILYIKENQVKKFYFCFIVGYVGLIWSHLTMALYSTILLLPFLYYLKDQLFHMKWIKHILVSVLVVTVIVLPGIVTTLSQKDVLVYRDGYVTSLSLLNENTLSLKDYISVNETYDWDVPVYLPLIIILSAFVSAYFYRKEIKKERFIFILFMMIPILIWMMSAYFPWNFVPHSLWMIQFPWRLLSILSIVISIIAPLWIGKVKIIWVKILFLFLVLISSISLLMKLTQRPYHIDGIDLEKGRGNMNEYYPVEYLTHPTYFEQSDTSISVRDGDGEIEAIQSEFPNIIFNVKTNTELTLELPLIYYDGYVVKDQEGNTTPLKRSEHGRGMVTIVRTGTYQVNYQGSFIGNILEVIRTIGIFTISVYGIASMIRIRWKK